MGVPWWPSGFTAAVCVQSLVGVQGSRKPGGTAKKKQKQKLAIKILYQIIANTPVQLSEIFI